jgi:hypothetical protein
MSYLNDWDKEIPNLDVVDDYKSERKEILKCQGKSFPFTFGDVSYNHERLSFISLLIHLVCS